MINETPASRLTRAIRTIATVYDQGLVDKCPDRFKSNLTELGLRPLETIDDIKAWEINWIRMMITLRLNIPKT